LFIVLINVVNDFQTVQLAQVKFWEILTIWLEDYQPKFTEMLMEPLLAILEAFKLECRPIVQIGTFLRDIIELECFKEIDSRLQVDYQRKITERMLF
jgi:hypothetical protein